MAKPLTRADLIERAARVAFRSVQVAGSNGGAYLVVDGRAMWALGTALDMTRPQEWSSVADAIRRAENGYRPPTEANRGRR